MFSYQERLIDSKNTSVAGLVLGSYQFPRCDRLTSIKNLEAESLHVCKYSKRIPLGPRSTYAFTTANAQNCTTNLQKFLILPTIFHILGFESKHHEDPRRPRPQRPFVPLPPSSSRLPRGLKAAPLRADYLLCRNCRVSWCFPCGRRRHGCCRCPPRCQRHLGDR